MPGVGRIAARFVGNATATAPDRVGEAGQLRLRVLRGRTCEALVVNTAGGIVGGDDLASDISVTGLGAAVTIGTVSAEKCYRSRGAQSVVATTLAVGDGARLDWLPQETILFDGAVLRRSLTLDVATTGTFIGAETLVFGRLARGETMVSGSMRDIWRVRRGGRLVFADDTAITAPIGATLDRPAIGAGARAASLLLAIGGDTHGKLDATRAAMAPFGGNDTDVESGASLRDGILVVRLLSRSPETLRACLAAALGVFRQDLPRSWS